MPCILLTRPLDQSEKFAAEIADCGWRSAIWPLLTIENRFIRPVEPAADQSLIFTSARAVKALPDPAPVRTPAICVGPATAAAARDRGFTAVTNIEGDADILVQSLLDTAPKRYLHVRGAHSRGEVAERLTHANRPTEELIAYEAVASENAPAEIDTALKAGKIDALALFSPRSAAIFKRLVKSDWLGRMMTVYAISPAAAEPVRSMGFARVILADKPDGAGMRAAICSALDE